jgi:phosphoenolpyruvate carboxykinase (ATP)
MKYAEMLAENMRRHGSRAWLVNTGWFGGPYGVGRRIPLAYTRAIVAAIHGDRLAHVPAIPDPKFHLSIPTSCPGVPIEILTPAQTWSDAAAYESTAARVAELLDENHAKYACPTH